MNARPLASHAPKHALRWFENRFSFSWFVNSGGDIFIIKF
jgi:hypothetical protein